MLSKNSAAEILNICSGQRGTENMNKTLCTFLSSKTALSEGIKV